jgi:molybdopterin converting factor small subunit
VVEAHAGTVRVLLFGALREQLGDEVMVDAGAASTIAELWTLVTRDRPHLRDRRASVRAARNLAYCEWDDRVSAGDEVAFMPPVSGGVAEARP